MTVPLVSIAIPAYRHAKYIETCLASVCAQTYPELELVLIDDAMRRVTFQGTQLTDMRDLINRLQLALLPRTGFVFRKNEPDMSRDESGKLMVPVTLSKVPLALVTMMLALGMSRNTIPIMNCVTDP